MKCIFTDYYTNGDSNPKYLTKDLYSASAIKEKKKKFKKE